MVPCARRVVSFVEEWNTGEAGALVGSGINLIYFWGGFDLWESGLDLIYENKSKVAYLILIY